MKKYYYFFPLVLQKIGYVISWIALNFFTRLEINGRENLKNLGKPLILASNHTSEFDPAIFALILPIFSRLFPLYYVAFSKEKYGQFGLRSFLYGGKLFNLFGAYPLNYGHKDYEISLENHINLLKLGRTVCIFPEGRITKNGNLSPAHGGVAYLSYISSADVMPISINTFYNLSFKDFILRKRKVVVNIGLSIKTKEIVPQENPTVEDFKMGGQKVVDEIGKLLEIKSYVSEQVKI